MSYIAVLGAGAWGTTLAAMLSEKDYDVSLWVFEKDVADEMKSTGVNSAYLPGYTLPAGLQVTSEMGVALKDARYIVNAVPTQFTRAVFGAASSLVGAEANIVSASKGIENETYLTVSAIISKLTGRQASALSGPSFAAEVIRRLPTAVTLAGPDYSTCLQLQEVFTTDYFRVYTHHDILGVELGGALKNVIALAAGISEGLGLGNSARAALITRGLAEITRLGVSMGANEKTFTGLSGLGDLVLTCNSTLSRNFTVGFRLGKGEAIGDITASMKSVAEGVSTAKAAYELSLGQNVEMPIVEQVHMMLNAGKDPRVAVGDLMRRSLKAEFHG